MDKNTYISPDTVAVALKKEGYEVADNISINIDEFISQDPLSVVLKKYGKPSSGSKKTIAADYKALEDEFKSIKKTDDDDFIYWVSHITLNKNLEDAVSASELSAISIENVFEFIIEGTVNSIVRTTDLESGEMTEVRGHDEWYGTRRMEPSESKLTVEDAIKLYYDSEYRVEGNVVTLYKVLNPAPEYQYPFYSFGKDVHNQVLVNAVTGEVSHKVS